MPRIFDNIDQHLLPALAQTMEVADRGDFCVGYFNLRGWKRIDSRVEAWSGGPGHQCRLLVGMHQPPADTVKAALGLGRTDDGIDNATAHRLELRLAQEFRQQLTIGAPTNEDEAGLRRLANQIRSGKLVVKLFLRHPLHAKLYLLFRPDPVNPAVGFVGSSNLTLAGLANQGELNVDVMDRDACDKLARWFDERWNDRFCLDISKELGEIIEQSWAREALIPPYQIYVNMAYHLSREAREGLTEFRIPREFGNRLLDFQVAAVKIAAHHLNSRGGVLIGDVVGLGKTLMATALARIFRDDTGARTLIVCPKNLVSMWESYSELYDLGAKVVSISQFDRVADTLRRYQLVLVDESHNLRNREGARYRALRSYIAENESKVILLTATPYNKSYHDLSNQLRLFIGDEDKLPVRPERLIATMGELEFRRRHQVSPNSLGAFDLSDSADDWRDLMRLYLVRRTRSFIKENYAPVDLATGRRYLTFEDGTRSYFPERVPKRVPFTIDDDDPSDQYARLYSPEVVILIDSLELPRYGLGNYVDDAATRTATDDEQGQLDNLSRAGNRLMGFCRTNLFKRLESSGQSFLLSVERHILRNYIVLHAIRNGLPIPLGTQDSSLLDTGVRDEDPSLFAELDDGDEPDEVDGVAGAGQDEAAFARRAAELYGVYRGQGGHRFRWLRPSLFKPTLERALAADAEKLLRLRRDAGRWDPTRDTKLHALLDLLATQHPSDKVLVFSQFADTVRYLEQELTARGLTHLAGVTGQSPSPTEYAWRFSPVSNEQQRAVDRAAELRVLVATDVLSEGQNLQDAAIVVNYDLPWAIIRLIQRAGRVDRIGQPADRILCYSFLPADGVDRIINLRGRVRQRLRENAEVVGTDEAFFEDDDQRAVVDLYNEKAGILDDEDDGEVDLASYAYQIWKNAIERDPQLEREIPALPPVVFSTRALTSADHSPAGVLAYVRTGADYDALVWLDREGNVVTESQLAILRAAECAPATPPLPRLGEHHELVRQALEQATSQQQIVGGGLGRRTSARFRAYQRLKNYVESRQGTLFGNPELPENQDLKKAIEEIYTYPLQDYATGVLNRQLRMGVTDEQLAGVVRTLRDTQRLCRIEDDAARREPQIICSLGLAPAPAP